MMGPAAPRGCDRLAHNWWGSLAASSQIVRWCSLAHTLIVIGFRVAARDCSHSHAHAADDCSSWLGSRLILFLALASQPLHSDWLIAQDSHHIQVCSPANTVQVSDSAVRVRAFHAVSVGNWFVRSPDNILELSQDNQPQATRSKPAEYRRYNPYLLTMPVAEQQPGTPNREPKASPVSSITNLTALL